LKRHLEVLALFLIAFIVSAQILQTSSLPISNIDISQEFDDNLPPVRTVNLSFEVKDKDEWTELNISDVENVLNGSLAQFKGTIYNDGDTDAIAKSFVVRMFNSTNLVANYTYDYVFGGTDEIKINPFVSKTQNFTTNIYFPDPDQSYVFQIGFSYVLITNRTLDFFAGFTGNYSINMGEEEYVPPELIVVAFYFVTILILMHLGLGLYGNRKQKIEPKKPKYMR
jgi:hypothetical protein